MKKALHSLLRIAGTMALMLAVAATLVTLTVRDGTVVTAVIMFGMPWLVRLLAAAFSVVALGRKHWSAWVLIVMVAGYAGFEGVKSFHWRDDAPAAGGFDVTLWNCNRRLAGMQDQWPQLAGPRTRLVILIESGPFKDGSWEKFTAAQPGFTWQQLDGGIVAGVRGTFVAVEQMPMPDLQCCHRIRAVIEGRAYTILANDIPS